MKQIKISFIPLIIILSLNSCNNNLQTNTNIMKSKVEQFTEVSLKTDLNVIDPEEKKMLPYLFDAARIMDSLFWIQAYGEKQKLLSKDLDEYTIQFIELNYGTWERLNGNKPFIEGIGDKPLGANFYPVDMTNEEFDNFNNKDKSSLYTMIRRNKDGELITIPYHVFFHEQVKHASDLILKAAGHAKNPGLKKYLELRANALLTDEYYTSDIAWMDMKTNQIDFVVGPIENYEDQLFGYKTAYEAFILIKDLEWSNRLENYVSLLPKLQEDLPVDKKYKQESPGLNSDLGVYDVIFYAGDCNAGAKTIAINLPNDERVHIEKGSRRLQLKNSMKAKFDSILIPITEIIISKDQRKHVTFDAFFDNVMFHEVGHGLGIKETINGKGTVREALKEQYSALEEGKADILSLYITTRLNEWGELNNNLMDNYVTFMAGIFRSIRFGVSSAHGRANLLRYNYFREKDAFSRNNDGTYSINFDKMKEAMISLSEMILTLQGNGDYKKAVKLIEEKGFIPSDLEKDLNKINNSNIPVDIRFVQGEKVTGL